jgi:GMP synthase-like glutamine amidotransferase
MTLRIHALFHTDYEDLNFIKHWAINHQHTITYTRSYHKDTLPALGSFDWLIVMGGPMSVHDEDNHPWLIEEKRLIKQSMDSGKTVIGVCLGCAAYCALLGGERKAGRRKRNRLVTHSVD